MTIGRWRWVSATLCGTFCLGAMLGCASEGRGAAAGADRFPERQAIEAVLSQANRGFELGDADLFANAFAPDGSYVLDEKAPVFGYDKMIYRGRGEIRTIISDRLDKARKTDPKTLSYDPATLRRFNRNSDDVIEFVDRDTARHTSTWMVVMHTNVNIHISAIGRYEDTLVRRGGKWLIEKRIRTE